MPSIPSTTSRHRHLVPTHVRTPETLLTVAGLSLSVRQFLLLLVGAALSYQVWRACGVLVWLPAGQVVRVLVTALPAGAALALAFVWLAGRALDTWSVVLLRYLLRPRRFVWRTVRVSDPGWQAIGREETHDEA